MNLAEVREVARLRVAARRADSTTSKLQAQLQDMENSVQQLKTKVTVSVGVSLYKNYPTCKLCHRTGQGKGQCVPIKAYRYFSWP